MEWASCPWKESGNERSWYCNGWCTRQPWIWSWLATSPRFTKEAIVSSPCFASVCVSVYVRVCVCVLTKTLHLQQNQNRCTTCVVTYTRVHSHETSDYRRLRIAQNFLFLMGSILSIMTQSSCSVNSLIGWLTSIVFTFICFRLTGDSSTQIGSELLDNLPS